MAAVTIEGRPAAKTRLGDNQEAWIAEVEIAGKQTVQVEARSAGGVLAKGSFAVANPPRNPEIVGPLEIPAEVEFQVVSKRGPATLEVDGQSLPLKDGVAVWSQSKFRNQVAVRAASTSNHCDIQISPAAGLRKKEQLVVDPTAAFTVHSPQKVEGTNADALFGQEIVFDASASSPTNLREYVWDFGDGTKPKEANNTRIARHSYRLENATKTREVYKVSLQVRTEGGESEVFTREITVAVGRKQLEVDVQTFPSSAPTFLPGETILMRLVSRAGYLPNDIDSITVDFGDGRTTTTDIAGKPFAATLAAANGKAVLVSHSYAQVGRYRPKITYTHRAASLKGEFPAALFLGSSNMPEITIAPAQSSDGQMAARAWAEAHKRLVEALTAVKVTKDTRIALTALREPNFENTDLPEARVIDRLTASLVDDGFSVLERTASALARLAPESVVDIRSELESHNGSPNQVPQSYLTTLDYGLRVKHEDARPIHYSIALEGTADRLMQITNAATQFGAGKASPALAAGAAPTTASWENSSQGDAWKLLKNMPVLVARFATANNVVALEVLSGKSAGAVQDCDITVTPPDFYDAALDLPAVRRTATARLHVRVLERDGSIKKVVQIQGEYSELAPVLGEVRVAPRP